MHTHKTCSQRRMNMQVFLSSGLPNQDDLVFIFIGEFRMRIIFNGVQRKALRRIMCERQQAYCEVEEPISASWRTNI